MTGWEVCVGMIRGKGNTEENPGDFLIYCMIRIDMTEKYSHCESSKGG
jgi:hypothetical protein